MAFGLCLALGVSLLLSLCSFAKCADVPKELFDMECQDRFFKISILSLTGDEPRFEAVDDAGIYPITKQYAAECGYSIGVYPLAGHVELRASYFSCHADNKDDKTFTFNFNLITTHEGQEVAYNLKKMCSPSLPWSPREVTCEVNYMEVSVRSDVTCPTGTKKDDWNATLTTAYASATSDWQMMFQRGKEQLSPMTLAEARKQGYVFEVTDGRLVFRTPYGQPQSLTTMVDGVPVEVVQLTLFSRQNWVVLMVDLVAACSMYEGGYNGSSLLWETPQVSEFYGLENPQVNMGVAGQLLEQPIADERGYMMEKHGATIHVSIPYNAEGSYRKGYVMDNLYMEYFVFHLYFEQQFVDENHVDTRLRLQRPLVTSLLSGHVFTVNRTVFEERVFTVYLGDFSEDVELAAVTLNGRFCTVPFEHTHYTISKVLQPNGTHGYTLRVPFEDPDVVMELSSGILRYTLDLNYTLTVLPEKEPFYHFASVEALQPNVFLPAFEAHCSEKGIEFKLDHQPFDYLWEVYIGADPLTPELAADRGYIMNNDSKTLLLTVPILTDDFVYEKIGLKTFSGTAEIFIKDRRTLEVQGSTAKTCEFPTSEFIVCSTDGKLTVLTDMPMDIPTGGLPFSFSLLDRQCQPKEADDMRVLFSFGLDTCGTRVELSKDHVIYENDIVINQNILPTGTPVARTATARTATENVTVQCVYPLAGLHRLFLARRFESDVPGVGSILYPKSPVESLHQPTLQQPTLPPMRSTTNAWHFFTTGLQQPTLPPSKPTTTRKTTVSRTRKPAKRLPLHPPAEYIRVVRILKDLTTNLKETTKKSAR